MKKKMVWPIWIGLILVYCSLPAPQLSEVPPTSQPTALIPEPAGVTKTVDLIFTPSPEPSPESTSKPSTTPTTSYVVWSSVEVIQAFRDAQLEVGDTWVMSNEDHGLNPIEVLEGMRFRIPSQCTDCSARVFSFGDPQNLDMAVMYYKELAKINVFYASWLFVRDNILVQIHGSIPGEIARNYEAALQKLK